MLVCFNGQSNLHSPGRRDSLVHATRTPSHLSVYPIYLSYCMDGWWMQRLGKVTVHLLINFRLQEWLSKDGQGFSVYKLINFSLHECSSMCKYSHHYNKKKMNG